MDVHPSGPRPRVLPVEPYRAMATPTSGYAPDSSHQPGRPPIIPRRTKHLQSVEESPPERPGQTSRFPGSPGDFKSYRPRTLSHGESQGPSIYGHGNSTHSTVETNSTQRQEELHLLRIRVEDLGVENNKVRLVKGGWCNVHRKKVPCLHKYGWLVMICGIGKGWRGK